MESDIEHRRWPRVFPTQEVCLVAERRKGCKPAKYPGDEKKACRWREKVSVLSCPSYNANSQAPKSIHGNCSPWESAGRGEVQYEATEIITTHGAQETADTHQEEVTHVNIGNSLLRPNGSRLSCGATPR